RACSVAVREDQIHLHETLAAAAHSQRLEHAFAQLASNFLLGKPCEPISAADRSDRGRHVADRPTLVRLDCRTLVSIGGRIAYDEVTMIAQIAHRDFAAELVERMTRVRNRNGIHRYQALAGHPGRN